MQPVIDPRHGDIEDDASSTKSRSMLSLAGGMLVEISLPKLIIAWVLLLVVPGVLLGVVPIVTTMWFRAITDNVASPEVGLWTTIVLVLATGAIGWFGWRPLFRLAETSFWSLNALLVQPGYAACREVLRHFSERLLSATATDVSRGKLRGWSRRRRRGASVRPGAACGRMGVAESASLRQLRRDRFLQPVRQGGARQQHLGGCRLSRGRGAVLGFRRRADAAGHHAPRRSARAPRSVAFGASPISRTSIS